ncbi:MAG: hypothetical protein GY932_04040 [Arcobacter sp.]|nr:hypothetical protein [Flavobacteriaceae bacterium]MCP4969754.1 hypothetical protein [Arcobacter sp.]
MDFCENPGTIIRASEARKLSQRTDYKKDINYNLTFNRLMKIIENSAKQGKEYIEFETPSFVLDGSLADPILLARQLKKRLTQLEYNVTRDNNKLLISWET